MSFPIKKIREFMSPKVKKNRSYLMSHAYSIGIEEKILYQNLLATGESQIMKNDHLGNEIRCIETHWVSHKVEHYETEKMYQDVSSGVLYDFDTSNYVVEFSWGWGKPRSFRQPVFKKIDVVQISSSNPCYVVSGMGYHGIVDDIAAILYLLNNRYPSITIVITHNNLWVRDLLKFFGIFDKNFVLVKHGAWIDCQKLVNISKPAFAEFPHSFKIAQLTKYAGEKCNRTFLSTSIPDLSELPSVIYVTRRDSGNRALSSETKIEELMDKMSIPVIRLADLSAGEQIKLFSQLKIVIGFHGAGLVNIVWAQKSLKVLELFFENNINSCYSSISHLMGHYYDNFKFEGNLVDLNDKIRCFIGRD